MKTEFYHRHILSAPFTPRYLWGSSDWSSDAHFVVYWANIGQRGSCSQWMVPGTDPEDTTPKGGHQTASLQSIVEAAGRSKVRWCSCKASARGFGQHMAWCPAGQGEHPNMEKGNK